MNQRITVVCLFLMMALGVPFLTLAKSDNSSNNAGIPEIDGVYKVPGQPNLKVRVFVHYPKNDGKPAPALTCTADDNSSTAIVGATGWRLPNQWSYTLNPISAPTAALRDSLPTIALQSFGAWTTALGDKVTISRSAVDTNVSKAAFDRKNIITWGRTSGSALGVTYTWADNAGNVLETDTILNLKFPWSWGACNASYYDAQDILTHELGHWLGLDDEYKSAYANHTMYGYGSKGEIKKNTLTEGDATGANLVYN